MVKLKMMARKNNATVNKTGTDYNQQIDYTNVLLGKSYNLYQWVEQKITSLSTINGVFLAALGVVFKDFNFSTISTVLISISFVLICISFFICLIGVIPTMLSKREKAIKQYERYNNLRSVIAISSFTYEQYREQFLNSTEQDRLDNNLFQIVSMSCIINKDQRLLRKGVILTGLGVFSFIVCFCLYSAKNMRAELQKEASVKTKRLLGKNEKRPIVKDSIYTQFRKNNGK